MKISYAVMAHVDRYEAAIALAIPLQAGVVVDDGHRGETANGDAAWGAYDDDADWHVVLQDDALPVDGFREALHRALSAAPPTVVSLYVGTGRPRQAQVSFALQQAAGVGAAWLSSTDLLWGVAAAMPTAHIRPFLSSAVSDLPYDRRIGAYFRTKRLPVMYLNPSLVDHADGPSLIDHPWGAPTSPRRAWAVGVNDTYNTPVVRF